jgi:predicted DNA-binding transcriptional regulator AlpA
MLLMRQSTKCCCRKPEGDGQMTDKLLTIDELAETLGGLGRASIYRHVKSLAGFPQPVKVGSATRFRHSDVQAYIRCDHLSAEEIS